MGVWITWTYQKFEGLVVLKVMVICRPQCIAIFLLATYTNRGFVPHRFDIWTRQLNDVALHPITNYRMLYIELASRLINDKVVESCFPFADMSPDIR